MREMACSRVFGHRNVTTTVSAGICFWSFAVGGVLSPERHFLNTCVVVSILSLLMNILLLYVIILFLWVAIFCICVGFVYMCVFYPVCKFALLFCTTF